MDDSQEPGHIGMLYLYRVFGKWVWQHTHSRA